MKNYEPIEIRPLTLKGVFGVTWAIYKRGFGAMLLYTLIYFLLSFAVAVLPSLPVFLRVIPTLVRGFEPATSEEAFRMIGSLFASSSLSLLSWAALYLLLMPVFCGTAFGEMSARIYGSASDIGTLLKRTKFSLRRFFTTSLSYWVSTLVIEFAVGLVGGMLVLIAVISNIPSLASGSPDAGVAILSIVLVALALAVISLIGYSFIFLTFPIAVNEKAKAFKAVGRSIKLASKKFGRVVGTMFITLIVLLLLGALCTGVVILLDGSAVAVVVASVLYIFVMLMFIPYQYALQTVLYFDIRTRAEGEAWLNAPAEGSFTPAEAPAEGSFTPAEGAFKLPTEGAPAEGAYTPAEGAPAEGAYTPAENPPAQNDPTDPYNN